MSTPTYTVNIDDQESLVRIGEVIIPQLRIGTESFGTIRLAGGVPGPPGESGGALLTDHINDLTPHPAYDDIPSLVLVFENGLV